MDLEPTKKATILVWLAYAIGAFPKSGWFPGTRKIAIREFRDFSLWEGLPSQTKRLGLALGPSTGRKEASAGRKDGDPAGQTQVAAALLCPFG